MHSIHFLINRDPVSFNYEVNKLRVSKTIFFLLQPTRKQNWKWRERTTELNYSLSEVTK